ncbi:hypothetical protein JOL62DRAFT_585874 [Phyllosticta paracitricarpa]|uniref:Secreted protein n=1 Tax=Phyllosticta paracitricarpa TaxID=2016321 RepID=A0ABR1MVG4_9PEZI
MTLICRMVAGHLLLPSLLSSSRSAIRSSFRPSRSLPLFPPLEPNSFDVIHPGRQQKRQSFHARHGKQPNKLPRAKAGRAGRNYRRRRPRPAQHQLVTKARACPPCVQRCTWWLLI